MPTPSRGGSPIERPRAQKLGTMAPELEQSISRSLQAMLADLPDGASFAELETKEYGVFLSDLDRFVPGILDEIHPEWRDERGLNASTTDGIVPLVARKTGERKAELFGISWLLTREAACVTVPIHVRLQVAPVEGEITWLELRIGERGKRKYGRVQPPDDSMSVFPKRFYLLDGNYDRIDWFYEVTFGKRSRP
jgi:hypothetical protein